MEIDWQRRAIAAEKTVEVLKRKVLELYAGDATQFQRQVRRAERREEEARRRRELTEVRALELKRHNERLEQVVADRTRDLRVILDNVTCGFLVVNRDGSVREGYTASCERLLGTERVAGRAIAELLGIAGTSAVEWMVLGFEQFFLDVLPDFVCLAQIQTLFPIGESTLQVEWMPLRSEAGEPEAVLLTLTDVTQRLEAERMARENGRLLTILGQRATFLSCVGDARELLRAAREAIDGRDVEFVKRALHTVKGNAGAYDLYEVVAAAHEAEAAPRITCAEIDRVEGALRAFVTEHESLLDFRYEEAEATFAVSETELNRLLRLASGPTRADVERWTARVVLKRLDHVLGPIDSYVTNLAQRFGKAVDLDVRGADIMIDSYRLKPVLNNLNHLLRNAVVHGIEPMDERGDKPARGAIEIVASETSAEWLLAVTDDGSGIDRDALLRRAAEMGLVEAAEVEGLRGDASLQLIFLDGLSTTSNVTDASGRGVGLSAVRSGEIGRAHV